MNRWEDSVRIYFKGIDIGVRNLMESTQDTDYCKNFVNPWFLYTWNYYFINGGENKFSSSRNQSFFLVGWNVIHVSLLAAETQVPFRK